MVDDFTPPIQKGELYFILKSLDYTLTPSGLFHNGNLQAGWYGWQRVFFNRQKQHPVVIIW
jgi:hypothetical protein